MSKAVHTMPEAIITRPSQAAWGCISTPGWVPFPKKIPRRHALIDAVGRIDDPCDRPVFKSPDWKPKPAYSAPKEGLPNDVCDLEDYRDVKEQEELPPGAALINIGKDTPKGVTLRLPAMYMDESNPEAPSIDKCCTESRTLDPTRKKFAEIVASQQAQQPCPETCHPVNPDYSCTGIIGEIMRDPTFVDVPEKDKCLPLSLRSGTKPGDWRELKPLTGWEYINGQRTCDLYPIDNNLPSRFNNPLWFEGYGCERPVHPFYVTTTSDYGRFSPNPHTMCQRFFPRSGKFTKIMSAGGMYRNRTLNTSNTKSIV